MKQVGKLTRLLDIQIGDHIQLIGITNLSQREEGVVMRSCPEMVPLITVAGRNPSGGVYFRHYQQTIEGVEAIGNPRRVRDASLNEEYNRALLGAGI